MSKLLPLFFILGFLSGCNEQPESSSGSASPVSKTPKEGLYQAQLNALEKAKNVESILENSTKQRADEILKQQR